MLATGPFGLQPYGMGMPLLYRVIAGADALVAPRASISSVIGALSSATAVVAAGASDTFNVGQLRGAVAGFLQSAAFTVPSRSTAGSQAEVVAAALIDAVLTGRLLPSAPEDGQRVQIGWRYFVWRAALGRWRPDGPAPHTNYG